MGRKLFLFGLAVMVLFSLAHFGGFLHACYVARFEPSMQPLTQAMRESTSHLLGFRPSILDLREYFSLNFSILMMLCAAVGFTSIEPRHQESHRLRRMAGLYAVGMSVLFASSCYFGIPQGIVTSLFLAITFTLSAGSSRAAAV